jgi:hypothetical protein
MTISAYGGSTKTVSATPVLTVAATYAANDFVGTSATAITFSNCATVDGGTGVILGATLIDNDLQSVAMELWLFDDTPADLPADSAAWTFTDAVTPICVIPFSAYYASVLNSVSCGAPAYPVPFKCAAGSTAIYGCLVNRGTPPAGWATLKLTVKLSILQD